MRLKYGVIFTMWGNRVNNTSHVSRVEVKHNIDMRFCHIVIFDTVYVWQKKFSLPIPSQEISSNGNGNV